MRIAILAGNSGPASNRDAGFLCPVGEDPLLLHLMRSLATRDSNDFVVALAGGGQEVKDYFLNLRRPEPEIRLNLGAGWAFEGSDPDEWQVSLLDTGPRTRGGGRLLRMAYLLRDGAFVVAVTDGVADIDLADVVTFHQSHDGLATIVAVRRPEDSTREPLGASFIPESVQDENEDEAETEWIDAGCYVFEPGVLRYLSCDSDSIEDLLTRLQHQDEVHTYIHNGRWNCLETVDDVREYESFLRQTEEQEVLTA